MPASRPLITVPTVRPREAGGARSAAKGTICWARVANTPIAAEASHQRAQRVCERRAHGRERQHPALHQDEPPPVHPVAERHQQHDARRIAELRGHRDEADIPAMAEIARDQAEHGLVVVEVGDRAPGRRRHDQQQRSG